MSDKPSSGYPPSVAADGQRPENDAEPPPKAKRKTVTLLHSATLGEWYDALIAELATDPALFVRGGSLVTVDPVNAAITPVNKTRLGEMITGVCEVWEQRGEKLNPVSIPRDAVLKGILQRRIYPGVRELREVLPHPMILADGTVLTEAGYHNGLYLPPHGLELRVPDRPTRADAERALRVLKEPVCDFPFAKPMHLSAWISMLLTAVTAAAHEGNVPMVLVDADRKGTGKTKLAHIVSYIVDGDEAEIHEWKKGEQLGHLIFAAALAGKRLFLIDDVADEIRGQRLNAVLTSRRLGDRGMHTKKMQGVRHTLQPVVTGNELAVASDMTRRVIGMRLQALDERPEHRTGFKHPNIETYTLEHRAELLAAVLTIVRAYVVAGRPTVKTTRLGSYFEWCDWVCAPLVWLGLPSPVDTQDEYAQGPASEAGKLKEIVTAWRAVLGDEAITCEDLVDALGSRKYRTLRDALEHKGLNTRNSVRLGVALKKERSTSQGWGFVAVGKKKNKTLWAVRRVQRAKVRD